MTNNSLEAWANYAYEIAREASEAIMYYYNNPENRLTQYKADKSPLTNADEASHKILFQYLSQYALDAAGPVPVLSEEGNFPTFVERQRWMRYWCVDPLDGTKEFLAQNDEFSINIALIEHHQPVVGIVYVPAQKKGYMAWRGGGAYRIDEQGAKERIVTQIPGRDPLRVLVSRHSNVENVYPWISALGKTLLVQQGSALKFCALASGEADLFLRLTPTSEWDNAAGQCLLEEAGGTLFTFNLEPLTYNRSGVFEQGAFIAVGDKHRDWVKIFNKQLNQKF
jgi:3'(2'), 5'-bisphosphate nucleotidase